MKLKEYLEGMEQVIADNPGALEWEVIYSSDNLGSHFEPVNSWPSVGHCSPDHGGIDAWSSPAVPRNCICLN